MSQLGLGQLQAAGFSMHDTGCGMPKQMEAVSAWLSPDSGSIHRRIQHLLAQKASSGRVAIVPAKDKVFSRHKQRTLTVSLKSAHQHFGQMELTSAGRGFRCDQPPSPKAVRDMQQLPVQIDVLPSESEQFSDP